MGGQTPGRHGVDWGRVHPLGPGGAGGPRTAGKPAPLPQPQAEKVDAVVKVAGLLPVRVLGAFYETLPDPSVQQVTKTVEGYWSRSYRANDQFALATFAVPDQYVYVLTDVEYYALAPSRNLAAPETALGDHQLVGLLRFELNIGNRQPMRLDAETVNPNTSSGSNASSGWGLLNTTFGARRSASFAVYARSQQTVQVNVTLIDVPRFNLSKIGAQFHGFGVPEGLFAKIFANSL